MARVIRESHSLQIIEGLESIRFNDQRFRLSCAPPESDIQGNRFAAAWTPIILKKDEIMDVGDWFKNLPDGQPSDIPELNPTGLFTAVNTPKRRAALISRTPAALESRLGADELSDALASVNVAIKNLLDQTADTVPGTTEDRIRELGLELPEGTTAKDGVALFAEHKEGELKLFPARHCLISHEAGQQLGAWMLDGVAALKSTTSGWGQPAS